MQKQFYIIILCILSVFLFSCDEQFHLNRTPSRMFTVHVPESYTGTVKVPLVIVLHGYHHDISGIDEYTEFSKKSDAEGFIAVYPEGTREIYEKRNYVWNAAPFFADGSRHAEDVEFISELIDTLLKAFTIDSGKVFIAGHSNGAMMAYKIGAHLSYKVSAIACVAGPMLGPVKKPTSPVPLIHIHSARDDVVPYKGGRIFGRLYCPPQDSVFSVWQGWNVCSVICDTIKKDGLHHEVRWKSSTGDGDIVLCYLYEAGHEWPSVARSKWSATDRIWEFFKEVGTAR